MSDVALPKKVFKVFSEQPLRPDQEDLYVSLDELRGSADVVKRLAGTIRTSDDFTAQVLAGHQGSGKSTELMRLKKEREANDPKYFVVLCEADEDIDRNDIDFPEVLIALLRQMAGQLKERAGINLMPGFLKSRFEWWKNLFGAEIDFEKLDLNVSLLKISGTMKNSPSARADVRKHMEPDTNNLLNAANDLIGEATLELGKKGYAGLVVVIDDLDKMIVRPLGESGHTTDENLFINRAPQMTGFHCHTVYTMPLSLAYSKHHQTLKQLYKRMPVLPMVKIRTMPPNPQAYQPGFVAMRKMINLRLGSIATSQTEIFEDDLVCDELVRISGGQPSALMSMIREALIADGLPIKQASLQRVRREGKREFQRQLRRDDWALLEKYRDDGTYVCDESQEPIYRELLESRALLHYANDDEWDALNPLVEELTPPRTEAPRVSTL